MATAADSGRDCRKQEPEHHGATAKCDGIKYSRKDLLMQLMLHAYVSSLLKCQSTRVRNGFSAHFVYANPYFFSCPMHCHVSACTDMIGYSYLDVVFQ